MNSDAKRFRRRAKKQRPSQKHHQNDAFFESQVQRKCEKCEEEEKQNVQKKSVGHSSHKGKSFFGHFMNNINTKGSPLSKNQRTFFESRMQEYFGDVRLHTDQDASNAAKEIGAKAFTWQNHIVVNSSYFNANSLESQQLMAHELKHVRQQKEGKHKIQMMPEEESTPETDREQSMDQEAQEGSRETVASEMEAEQEEEKILEPETVPDFQTFGAPHTQTVFANSVTFRGKTDATFDGGIGSTRNLSRTPAEACAGCPDNDCWHYTGQLVINYSVSTSVNLPDVPEGLTECQHQRVRNAIDNVLVPHEQEHVTAFSQYNGTVTLFIDYTGCSDGIEGYVQGLHDANEAARQAAAQSASDTLDPFHVLVDLDCEDESTTPAPEQPESE